MRVLVLDGHENQAVACTRSLARAGHTVIVGADARWSKAGLSRAASGHFTYPAPGADASAFVERVAEQAARVPGTLVLPMTERSTLPISRERDRLRDARARLVLPSHARVLQAFDKETTTSLAERLGLTVPRTRTLSGDHVEAAIAADALHYPVVLKPRASEEAAGSSVRTTGAPAYARNASELLAAWHDMRARCSAMLIQEYVVGRGEGYFALVDRGRVRAEFAHKRIRDVRPTGSGSAVRESAAVHPELRRQGQAVLSALDWHGVAMVEFRVRPDGTPVFLEVNGRFWNSLPLAVYAGADFPALLAALAEHGRVDAPPPYAVGLRCRWLLGDVRHLLDVWRGAPAGYPGRFPGRWSTLIECLTPVRGTYHDNFQWRDPLPEAADWLHFFGRRLPAFLADSERKVHASRRAAHP